MRGLLRFPTLLLRFSWNIRLTVLVIAFVVCQIIYVLLYPLTHVATTVVIPIVLAAWLFHYRGMLLCLLVSVCTVKFANQFLLHIPFWFISSSVFVVAGLISLLI